MREEPSRFQSLIMVEQKAKDWPRAQGLICVPTMMKNWSARHKRRSERGQREANRITGWPNKQAPFGQEGNGGEREVLCGALHCSCRAGATQP